MDKRACLFIKMIVEKNNKVSVEYEGKLEDGTVFDSSSRDGESKPLEFAAGTGQVIPGFDNAILGMKVGEEKEFSIEAKDAYGEHREELKQEVPRDKLPAEPEPKEGMALIVSSPEGHQMPVKILEVREKEVVIDLNHPLSGKKLIFKIKVLNIEKDSEKTEEENKEENGKEI